VNWITVHLKIEEHGSAASGKPVEAVVNLDAVSAVQRMSDGTAMLIWQTSSPRAVWRLTESYDLIFTRIHDKENHP